MRRLRLPRGTLLVLASHPDDESLGCGGVVAAHCRAGRRAVVAFATDGGAGSPARLRGPRLAELRRAEARAACRVLGAECEFWGLPDGRLARAVGLRARVAEALARLRPAAVLAPGADDPHPDHRALARALARAEGRRRAEWIYEAASAVRPDAAADIGPDLRRKLAALARHRTQERAHGFVEFARRRAQARAILLPGADFAEVFARGGAR
ncbi:MAG: PIG-L family deacetylase [Elusimicrobia bacterium]|nr:PIG-L family deacetylase [Elusimicrobiota bacterium]